MTSTRTRDPWAEPSDYMATARRWSEVAEENGWRESKAQRCPRVVLGRRCLVYGWKSNQQPSPCLCCQWYAQYGSRVDDHARMWLDRDGRHVLTYEPYTTHLGDGGARWRADVLPRFRADAAALGLTVTVGDRSPHYPGSTTLLIVSKAEANEGGSR
jgi:hypothetical protein